MNKYHFYLQPSRKAGVENKAIVEMVKVVGGDDKNVHTTTVDKYAASVKDTQEEAGFAAANAAWRERIGLSDAKSGAALAKNLEKLQAQHDEALAAAAHHQDLAEGLAEKLQAAQALSAVLSQKD